MFFSWLDSILIIPLMFIDFDATDHWEETGMNQVIPAAASLASLSSLGLLREKMMKRQPKTEEEWAQQDMMRNQRLQKREEHTRRGARNAWSAAAGLSTFAAVSTTQLPSARGFNTNLESTTSSLTAARSNENVLSDNHNFGFNGGATNAATEDYGFESELSLHTSETFVNDEFTSQYDGHLEEGNFAVDSSSFTIASEFSRGSYGIYDTKAPLKETTYSNVNSGFSAPLKESAPRKNPSFMFGGVSLRSLKSKFDSIVKEKTSEPEQKVEKVQQAPPDKPAPIKSVKVESPPKVKIKPVDKPAPVFPSPSQPETSTNIPEKIPLARDELSPVKPIVKPQTSSIPDKIQLSPDNVVPKQQTAPTEPKVIIERDEPSKPPALSQPPTAVVPPKISDMKAAILDKVDSIKPPPLPAIPKPTTNTENRQTYSSEVSEFFDDITDMIPTSAIQSPDGFYKGLGGGTFAALVAKGLQGSTKRRKTIGASPKEVAKASYQNGGLPPRTSSSQNNIATNQPYAFRSSSADTASVQQSNFEIKTPTSYASSTTQATSGEARVSVAIESTLEEGSSVQFSTSTSSGGVSFSEQPPSYSKNAINTQITDNSGSYLDSLQSAPTTVSSKGIGLQSYLGGLSNTPPTTSNTYCIGTSMDRFSSSLDSISQDLDSMNGVDMDFDSIDSVYKDLKYASQEISSVSETLSAQESHNGNTDNAQIGSYLDSISDETAALYCGQGLTSYLDDLGISQDSAIVRSGQGLTSYLDDLSSASSLQCDLHEQASYAYVDPAPAFSADPVPSSYEHYDSSTPNQGSYLDSISQGMVMAQPGQGLTSYLSDLSAAAPLEFDIPKQSNQAIESVQDPAASSSLRYPDQSVSSNPVEIMTNNSGRPRRVRVFVDASVNVSRN
jgi:hypothetical protein